MTRYQRLKAYVQDIPPLIGLSILSAIILLVVVRLIGVLTDWALASQGRVAVTTGDFMFLFTTWQGWAMLALGVVAILVHMALNINAGVALAGQLVRGERASIRGSIAEGFRALRGFLCPAGVLIVAYIAFIVPTVGVGLSLTMTENLRIPTFISNIIDGTPLFAVAYWVVFVALALVGFAGIFCVHGVVLDGMDARAAVRQSFGFVRANWLGILRELVIFELASLGVALVVGLVLVVLTTLCASILAAGNAVDAGRMVLVAALLAGSVAATITGTLMVSLSTVKVTQLYCSFRQGERVQPGLRKRHAVALCASIACVVMAVSILFGRLVGENFDLVFPAEVAVKVIAHRCGGHEAPENTAIGVDVAGKLGDWACEIDIQRTSDGFYVVNHDDDFKRVTGDARTSSQMTLAEAQALRVKDDFHSGLGDQPVSTYEEILEHARAAGIKVLVELKGATADRQMADDAVRIAREMGMFDQCVFISLKYDLIDYIETTYPEADTGFLAFGSYGNIAGLNCDYLALEELAIDLDTIDAVHEAGKGIFVWTLNSEEQQLRFLDSDIDAIITDEITQANEVIERLESRTDVERVFDAVIFG